ncbi:MAG: hypothetical protein IKE00_02185 [Oscillospiraceae bacterium]|nr:hypothetical protein [Oscillospiraceae bacterium]
MEFGELDYQRIDVKTGGEPISVQVAFGPGDRIVFYPLGSHIGDNELLFGHCRFTSKKLIINHIEIDKLFDNQYETIVITRVE